ncbi:hypothetical protein [Actinokineospora terrae]|nr:hypothetical protein [Actinokineospora terrae]
MASDDASDVLPTAVVAQLELILGEQGRRVMECLETAAELLKLGADGAKGLRFAESAAFNVRVALESVVKGQTATPGGLPVIRQAWEAYQAAAAMSEASVPEARSRFDEVVRDQIERSDRSTLRDNQLLTFLVRRSGLGPLRTRQDPVGEFSKLRESASDAVHDHMGLAEAVTLFDRAVSWFVRMFMPPDAMMAKIIKLADQPWHGNEQVLELERTIVHGHHLRLFFSRVADPAWLVPLHAARLVRVPDPSELWPASGLLEGLGSTDPAAVADLLALVLVDTKTLSKSDRSSPQFEVLRVASQLGPCGYDLIAQIARQQPQHRGVQSLAAYAARKAGPSDPFVASVVQTVVTGKATDRHPHARSLLDHLVAGLTADNMDQRIRMLAGKTRSIATTLAVTLDRASLVSDLERENRLGVVLVYALARALSKATELGVSVTDQLAWINTITGEVGSRLTCRVLASGTTAHLPAMVDHIARRLASVEPTGDDRDLVVRVLALDPDPEYSGPWIDALGSPSSAIDTDERPPDDWIRGWRWASILPETVLGAWSDVLARMTSQFGTLDNSEFDKRARLWSYAGSAYSSDALGQLPVLEAADQVAAWRPDPSAGWQQNSARELARALETTVTAAPTAWAEDAVTVVDHLREPVYVLHYFLALAAQAAAVTGQAAVIFAAAEHARSQRWPPTLLGNDNFDYEPDWHNVDLATVELAAALARTNAALSGHLDTAWDWTLELISFTSTDDDPVEGRDVLHAAINNPSGRAVQAALAIADWEARNLTTIRTAFTHVLDDILELQGQRAAEYRAVLALHRLLLERLARPWLETNAAPLFATDRLGRTTLETTLTYSQPSDWFLQRFRNRLVTAAREGVDRATTWLLVGMLHQQDGYTGEALIDLLRSHPPALTSAAEHVASLVNDDNVDQEVLDTAVRFWQLLLDSDRTVVPAQVVRASGRWALVAALPNEIWAHLTHQTLNITAGAIDWPIEVAERARDSRTSVYCTRILYALLANGERWEQHHVANVAVDTLRLITADNGLIDEHFLRLRTALIERGHHDAEDTGPP